MWIWLASAFGVSLFAAAVFGARGAITSFGLGTVLAVMPGGAMLVGDILARGTYGESSSFDMVAAAAFSSIYWWMMAFPGSAIGLVIKTWFAKRRQAEDVF